MEGIVENEAIQLRVATFCVPLGLALQKLLLAGLRFESSKIDQFLKHLNQTLRNADNDAQGLEQCIQDCNKKWMDDSAEEQTSLVDLLCGIKANDRVEERSFRQVVALEDTRHRWKFYFVTETMTHLVLPICYMFLVKKSSDKR